MDSQLTTRVASEQDIESIRMIYNHGIEERIAMEKLLIDE